MSLTRLQMSIKAFALFSFRNFNKLHTSIATIVTIFAWLITRWLLSNFPAFVQNTISFQRIHIALNNMWQIPRALRLTANAAFY